MQISDITIYNVNRQNFGTLGGIRRIVHTVPNDLADLSKSGIKNFRKLTLETIEKMHKVDFKPSGKDYGEYMFPAYAIDKNSGKPREVVVKLMDIGKNHEEYYILDPKKDMEIIGHRIFDYASDTGFIKEGHMKTLCDDLSGLGKVEQQISVERAIMQGHFTLELKSTPEAYLFHKGCGFEPIKRVKVLSQTKFKDKISELAYYLKMDEEKVKNMVVYRLHGDKILFDYNSSYSNVIEYMYKHEDKYNRLIPYCVEMYLPENSMKEWEKVIDKNPILIGKKLPEEYHAWENV